MGYTLSHNNQQGVKVKCTFFELRFYIKDENLIIVTFILLQKSVLIKNRGLNLSDNFIMQNTLI